MASRRYESALLATLTGLRERLVPERPLAWDDRLEGKTALVTGANRGLGRAIAVELAQRGARLLLACRGDASDALAEVGARGEAVQVDLGDLRSIDRLAGQLAERGVRLDVIVLNAGVVPNRARKTAQGLEVQLGVNYLANVRLVDRLMSRELLARGDRLPRIVAVSSESHRAPRAFELARLGAYEDYGIGGVMRRYGESKLALTAWTQELARRLEGRAAVHAICPGAVATGIAREAPRIFRPLLDPTIRRLFAAPAVAARPVAYLAGASAVEGKTGLYFHRWREKAPSELALDRAFASALWDESARVLERMALRD